jgi:hypothetical protein
MLAGVSAGVLSVVAVRDICGVVLLILKATKAFVTLPARHSAW